LEYYRLLLNSSLSPSFDDTINFFISNMSMISFAYTKNIAFALIYKV